MAAWPREFIVLWRALQRCLPKRWRRKSQSRVLIVDDEPAVCSFVARALQQEGYATEVAFSPSEALIKFLTHGRFDLLLTDENMPETRGHELAARLRQLDPDIRVLYLTGYSDMLFADRPALWQREAYVDKPVSVRGLSQAVSLLLSDGSAE